MKNIPESTYKLLKPIIAAIDGTVKIKSVTINSPGNYTLIVCDSLWATQGFTITIQGNQFKIIAIVPNVSITITGGAIAPIKGSFVLYHPKFYYGTIQSTIQDLDRKVNYNLLTSDKLPMIWLHESVDERINLDSLSAIHTRNSVDLYFMVDANFAQWTNDDHHTYAIDPMRQLCDSFISAMKLTGLVNDHLLEQIDLNEYARWGTTAKDGQSKKIFNMEMSGIKVKLNIPFMRGNKTCC